MNMLDKLGSSRRTRSMTVFSTHITDDAAIAEAVTDRIVCAPRLPSSKKSPAPATAITASFPFGDRNQSFTWPCSK